MASFCVKSDCSSKSACQEGLRRASPGINMSYQGPLEELRVELYNLKTNLETLVYQNPKLYNWCLQPLIDSLSESIGQIDREINNAPRNFRDRDW